MILVDDMLAVAFQYRDTELWKELTDSDVFAFRLSDGETGYCCVMGNAGEHLALGFYRGRKGFTTYLKTISLGNAHLSEIEMFEMTTTFDCINCDFMQASDMDVKTKKIIRNYADAHKLVYGAIDFAEAVGIDSEDSFDITKYILDEKKEEIPFAEFGRNGKHYLRADTDEEAELYIPIIMEAIGTDFTYSIEGVTDGEVDAAEVPFGDFDFSELNYDEEEFDKMFEKLNRESQD